MMNEQTLGYSAAMPLDWSQLRVLLWEVSDCFNTKNSAWDQVASYVNSRCKKSTARTSSELENVTSRLRRLYLSDHPSQDDAGLGARVWAQILYESAQRLFGGSRFMNLGYVGEIALELAEEDEPNRLFLQLYERALKHSQLGAKDVLEVGCGGGGGAHYLARCHQPASLIGVDLVEDNIKVCNSEKLDNLSFKCADAHDLCFGDESFDVVINIESSHSYANFQQFVNEVERVLRKGGKFALTDLRPVSDEWGDDKSWSSVESVLAKSQLVVKSDENITQNVLSAMKFSEDAKQELLAGDLLNKAEQLHFKEILLCEGSENHQRLASGAWMYRSMMLVKE